MGSQVRRPLPFSFFSPEARLFTHPLRRGRITQHQGHRTLLGTVEDLQRALPVTCQYQRVRVIEGIVATAGDEHRPGLYGIQQGWEPTAPISGNAYAVEHPAELALPHTLWDAAQRLKASQAARELFGDALVEHFAATREWEEREFRKHVSDWELDRYFEII